MFWHFLLSPKCPEYTYKPFLCCNFVLAPAFPFFIFLGAVLISAFVIGSVLISFMIRSISTSVTGSSGIDLLRISSTCYFHCSLLANPSSVIKFPHLSFTAFVVLRLSLLVFFFNIIHFFHSSITCCFLCFHGKSNVQSTHKRSALLTLDCHTSHTQNISAIQDARENGIHMLHLPPHTTHRLQQLDRCFFGPLMSKYNQAADK